MVLTVIGIITAILLPALARSREKAHQTVCTSNLRQIGLAVVQYAQDNDGTLPPNSDTARAGEYVHWAYGNVPNAPRWTLDYSRGMLSPYIKEVQVWHCPTVANLRMQNGELNIYPDYGVNDLLVGHSIRPLVLSEVQMPSATFLIADSVRVLNGLPRVAPYILPPSAHHPLVQGRHSGTANVLWLDGHVRAERPVASYTDVRGNTAAQLSAELVGDILKVPYMGNAQTDDYYYELVKP